MKFLRGIEKFRSYNFESKGLIGNFIINDGKYQKLLDTLKNYERILGVKDDKLIDNKENNVSNMLLNYLDYLDYYIVSHFLSNVYAIRFNPRSHMEVEQNIDLVVDFVTLLYKKRYPDDSEIDMVKYNELRVEFQKRFGRF